MAIGQTPVTKQESVSGASGPVKAAPSVEYSEDKLGKTKTVTDGKTPVTTSAREEGGGNDSSNDDMARGARQSYFNRTGKWPVCINTDCASYGRPHKNCLCYGPLSQSGTFYAHGGCIGPHKEDCEHYADGGTVIENTKFHTDPADTLGHVAAHHGLLGLLTKTGRSKSEDRHKSFEDYHNSSKRGHKALHHVEHILGSHRNEPDKGSREALKEHLKELRMNPEKLLEVGGNLGENLPDHAAHLGAIAGTATNYLEQLRPKEPMKAPLDSDVSTDKFEEEHYNRHLDLAQNPLLAIQHAKDGTLRPEDMATIHTLYPGLGKAIGSKAYEALLDAKAKNMEIPYHQKQGLSLLLGQTLDSTMSPQSMQAIIMSQAMPQTAQSAQKKTKKASGVELKEIDKVNKLSTTDIQDREFDKRKE